MTSQYRAPGAPTPPPPAPQANSYIAPTGTLQQPQPLSAPTPPVATPAPQDDPHRALLTQWHAHHANTARPVVHYRVTRGLEG
jgi:hypothetical protein